MPETFRLRFFNSTDNGSVAHNLDIQGSIEYALFKKNLETEPKKLNEFHALSDIVSHNPLAQEAFESRNNSNIQRSDVGNDISHAFDNAIANDLERDNFGTVNDGQEPEE